MGDTGAKTGEAGAAGEAQWSTSLLDSQLTEPISEDEYLYRVPDVSPQIYVSHGEVQGMLALD
jgi:hypothetical protein